MSNLFTRFNKTQRFTISREAFKQNVWLDAEEIFARDVETTGEPQPHILVGAWKHFFTGDQRIPSAPAYKYTLGVIIDEGGEETYYYVNCPSFMNNDFDQICADKRLVAAINKRECKIIPYEYESRGETRYGFRFYDEK